MHLALHETSACWGPPLVEKKSRAYRPPRERNKRVACHETWGVRRYRRIVREVCYDHHGSWSGASQDFLVPTCRNALSLRHRPTRPAITILHARAQQVLCRGMKCTFELILLQAIYFRTDIHYTFICLTTDQSSYTRYPIFLSLACYDMTLRPGQLLKSPW